MYVDYIIIGGGPAGILSHQILSQAGVEVCCIEANTNQPSIQVQHVHFFGQSCLRKVDQIVPNFLNRLSEDEVYHADSSGLMQTDHRDSYPWPSRAKFDQVLGDLLTEKLNVVEGRVKSVEYSSRGQVSPWQVKLDTGLLIHSRYLIDASGRSRVSLKAISHAISAPINIQEGPPTGTYVSCLLSNLKIDDARISLKYQSDEVDVLGLLLLRVSELQWQMTVQLPTEHSLRFSKLSLDVLLEIFPSEIRQYFIDVKQQSQFFHYGGQVSNIVYLDGLVNAPDSWLLIGDALLATPPYQGRGIDHLVAQIELLEVGIKNGLSFVEIQQQIFNHAQSAWLSATMADVFNSLELEV